MPAYFRSTVSEFIRYNEKALLGTLQAAYAGDGFSSQYLTQVRAWNRGVPLLQALLRRVIQRRPESGSWGLLLEYPLYRLRRRIDAVLLAGDTIIAIEYKDGAQQFASVDRRQIEEYALDLRDFHEGSRRRRIIPVLWCSEARNTASRSFLDSPSVTEPVLDVGTNGLEEVLATLRLGGLPTIVAEDWDGANYRPVPSVIDAATSIFSGHDVRTIALADAENLAVAAARIIELTHQAKRQGRRYLIFLSGVPGSGKTLAGLYAVHAEVDRAREDGGDIVYLSGNSPLVDVLREALSRDEFRRRRQQGEKAVIRDIRSQVRARIQHINDFLRQGLNQPPDAPPHEHAIVFDEAQRAWDEKQGKEKFSRTASEPRLLLELMARHQDWCACVCLIGSGQEINSGEQGVRGWGDAVRSLPKAERETWSLFAPADLYHESHENESNTLGVIPDGVLAHEEPSLELRVPRRTYRSPDYSKWVDRVIEGDLGGAKSLATALGEFPILLTRSLDTAKQWLRASAKGERRCGLVACSGAKRLRADGVGSSLHASAGDEIAHWYLDGPGDIRASFALEVPANEYTCQGLELDFVGVCWGGDLLWNAAECRWEYSRLNGNKWQTVRAERSIRFLKNSYRVLLTRAREGLVVWVPVGDASDLTRRPVPLDDTASLLLNCGARSLDRALEIS